MADEPPRSVLLWGADARLLSVARRWAEAGLQVTLAEPDVHDAARSRAMLERAGLSLPVITPHDPMPPADLVFESLPDAPVPPGADRVGMEGRAAPVRLYLHATTGFPHLAEIVPSAGADDEAPLAALLQTAGIEVIRTGGAGAGLRVAMMRAADDCLYDGATPAEVDAALVGFGFALGPYEQEDLLGLDKGYAARRSRGGFFKGLAEHAAAEGRLGKAAGVGWYRYPGGGGAVEDPLVEDLIRVEAHLAGLAPETLTSTEIVDRVTSALVEAAEAAMRDGRAGAAEVDRIAVAGLGFPAELGGPLAGREAGAKDGVSRPRPGAGAHG